MMDKWDRRFYRMAMEVATWSKDPDERVGCVLVSPDRRRQSCGYNGLPAGVEDTARRLTDSELKNRLSIHAELNAILNARTDLTGWTLYVTKSPCLGCAGAAVQAGIKRVVCRPLYTGSKWCPSQVQAQELLLEAGVACHVLQLTAI